MARKFLLAVLTVAALVALPRAGWCQSEYPIKPLFSLARLSFAVGGDYVFKQGGETSFLSTKREWEGSVLGAYSLTRHVALAASTRYGLDSKMFEERLGLRLNIGSD